MESIGSERKKRRTPLILCVVSLVLFLLLLYQYTQNRNEVEAKARQHARTETRRAAGQLGDDLEKLIQLAREIGGDLDSGKLARKDVDKRFLHSLEESPEFFGAGVAFHPENYDPQKSYGPEELDAVYYIRNDGRLDLAPIGYDYTKSDWYVKPMTEGPGWNEPYFGEASQAFLAEYCVPLQSLDRTGVVFVNYSLHEIKELVDSLSLGETGYIFLLSAKGTFIFHPTNKYITDGKTIFDLADELNSDHLRTLGEKAIQGESYLAGFTDQFSGQSSWIACEPIPSTEWSIGAIFIRNEIVSDDGANLHRRKIWLAMSFLLFLFLLILSLLFLISKSEDVRLWGGSLAAALVFLLGIASIWSLVLRQWTYYSTDGSALVATREGLDSFLTAYEQQVEMQHEESPLYLPTGIFIQSLEFSSANNVFLTGYTWQKYYDGVHDDLNRGIVFPESVSGSNTEAYRRREKDAEGKGYEIVGWYFEHTLRQKFNFVKYPFDHKDVWIRLWHQDFDRHVVQVPDLAAYKVPNPAARPGLEEDFVLSGWSLASSYFDYHIHNYNTNFGIEDYVGQEDYPELYFNIHIRRSFKDAFITNLVPLFVLASILFAVLMTVTRDQEKSAVFGFSTSGVLGACSGLFFVALLAHIQLRSELAAQKVIYLEYFYFVVYVAILVVAINAYLFSTDTRIPSICYRDNLIPKLLFWPAILGMLMVITLIQFY